MRFINQAYQNLIATFTAAQEQAINIPHELYSSINEISISAYNFIATTIIPPTTRMIVTGYNFTTYVVGNIARFVFNNIAEPMGRLSFNYFLMPTYTLLKKSSEHIVPIIIKAIKTIYTKILQPLYTNIECIAKQFINFININLLQPILNLSLDIINYAVDWASAFVKSVWNNIVYPFLINYWELIQKLLTLLSDLTKTIWINILQPTLRTMHKIWLDIFYPIFNKILDALLQAFNYFNANILPHMITIVKNFATITNNIAKYTIDFLEFIGNITLGIIGLPVYLYNQITGRAAVQTITTVNPHMRLISAAIGFLAIILGIHLSRKSRDQNQETNIDSATATATATNLNQESDVKSTPAPITVEYDTKHRQSRDINPTNAETANNQSSMKLYEPKASTSLVFQ